MRSKAPFRQQSGRGEVSELLMTGEQIPLQHEPESEQSNHYVDKSALWTELHQTSRCGMYSEE